MKTKKIEEKTGTVSVRLDFTYTLSPGVEYENIKDAIDKTLLAAFRYFDSHSSIGVSLKFKDARMIDDERT